MNTCEKGEKLAAEGLEPRVSGFLSLFSLFSPFFCEQVDLH